MSLHKVAQHLQASGRGNDTMLVHMSPREVSGLQSLARQHGGDLTINPHTGLVEAGFLDSILPTLAGAALTIGSGGTINPFMAAALVGGGTGIATGSVEKGLMAGLGAFGGAGLGGSLANAGAAAAPQATQAVTSAGSANPVVAKAAEAAAPAAASGSPIAANPAGMNPLTGGYIDVPVAPNPMNFSNALRGLGDVTTNGMDKFGDFAAQNKANLITSSVPLAASMANPNFSLFGEDKTFNPKKQRSTQRPYSFSVEQNPDAYAATDTTAEQNYFVEPRFTALPTYQAKEGGLMGYAVGGPVETMSAENAVGANMMYPQSQYQTPMYTNPMVQRPTPNNVISQGIDTPVNTYTGQQFAGGGLMSYASGGGTYHLGDYSDGGRLLKGPGDGVSDSIPASIGDRQPARLADGEFVVPARIVSELGNGSTDAGARKLYEMMDRVQKQRGKTVGKGKVAVNSKSDKYLPA